MSFEPVAVVINAIAKKLLSRPLLLKRALYVFEVAIVVFSVGYFSSFAFAICVSSTAMVVGYFIGRQINKLLI